jgi:hypothetical protein
MSYSPGDWVQYTLYPGSKPMLVANVMCDGSMLCSVCEYGGDWKIVRPQLVKQVHLDPIEALSLIGHYNGWFYNNKTLRSIFQETLVVALLSRKVQS